MNDQLTCPTCGFKKDISHCDECGNSLVSGSKNNSDNSQLLVLWGIIVIAIVTLYWFISDLIFIALDSYELYDSIKYIDDFMSLILALTPILFVLSIKNKTYRTIGIIFGAIIFAIRVYWVVKGLMPVEEFEYFQF